MDNFNQPPSNNLSDPNAWERKLVEKLASEGQKEAVRRRRWSNFFKALTFIYLGVVFAAFMGWFDGLKKGNIAKTSGEHTAVVKLNGIIMGESKASAERITEGLRAAFKDSGSKGVILHINTPGGSPVQSAQINAEIKALRAKYPDKPMHVVVDELCASGGMYVAVAADKIYVDPASIVGSIGVIMSGIGVTGAMEKLGLERRTITAGDNKALLDPMAPVNPKHTEHIKGMLGEVHTQFINAVKQGRGNRLKLDTPDLFSGLVWSGESAIKIGLVDAVGDVNSVAKNVIKAEEIIDYTVEENAFDRLAKRLGASFGSSIAASMGIEKSTSSSGLQMLWKPL